MCRVGKAAKAGGREGSGEECLLGHREAVEAASKGDRGRS